PPAELAGGDARTRGGRRLGGRRVRPGPGADARHRPLSRGGDPPGHRPMLDMDSLAAEATRSATGPLTIASAIWLVAELLRLGVAAAQAAAVPVSRLRVQNAGYFGVHTTPGRGGPLH